jgi:hypothetical protein
MCCMAEEFEEIVELGPEEVTEVEPSDPAARLPVVVEARVVDRAPTTVLPAVQAAAAAATGFVAGAATLALVKRRSARKLAHTQRRAQMSGWRTPAGGPVASMRTYLVHVRVLGPPEQ